MYYLREYESEMDQHLQQLTKQVIKKDKAKPFSQTIKYLSKEQIKKLFENIDDLRDKTLIRVLYSSGCRIGEIQKAFVSDFDLGEGIWYIPAVNTKSKKERSPRLHNSVVNDLKIYIEQYNIAKGKLFEIGDRQMQNVVKKYGAKVNIPDLHPHMFRHSHIVHALMDGVAMAAVMKQVGHVNLNTTQIYADLAMSDVKKAYANVEI